MDISKNKRARHDYQIIESFEAGIALVGSEIKSIRAKKVALQGSYVKVLTGRSRKSELFWIGGQINDTDDPKRSRKLLVGRSQINKLIGQTEQKRFTLVPLKLYISRSKAKLEVGLARGKAKHDRRQEIKKRDLEREAREQN